MTSLLTLSAVELARRIRTGEITSRAAVDAHIAHIERVNGSLNAVVEERFDQARKEADAADAAIAAGSKDLPPLHGVPCTIKENFAFPGMRQTSGLISRRDFIPSEEATAVTRLRRAGAIPLGTTNLSELAMWMESSNKVYGKTNNPYDPRHIVGGSSGGEGAIVGAGGSPFGLGADIGGSIRMPAFFNGVFGHKSTGGVVPGTGQFPPAENDALRYLCTGPIARRAEDLMPLMRILAGPDGIDTGCREVELGDPDAVDIAGLDVVDIRGNGFRRVSTDLQDAQARAAGALGAAGAKVRRTRVDTLRRSLEIWASMMTDAADTTFAELMGDGSRISGGRELLRWTARRSEHTLPAIGLALLESASELMPGRTQRFVEKGRELRAELEELIGPNGVMLYPSYTTPAPRHHRPLLMPFNWVYTAILNVAELPVTQVPLGLNEAGLPVGVQIVSIRDNDHVTIAVARYLEEVFGGWVPPPRFFGPAPA